MQKKSMISKQRSRMSFPLRNTIDPVRLFKSDCGFSPKYIRSVELDLFCLKSSHPQRCCSRLPQNRKLQHTQKLVKHPVFGSVKTLQVFDGTTSLNGQSTLSLTFQLTALPGSLAALLVVIDTSIHPWIIHPLYALHMPRAHHFDNLYRIRTIALKSTRKEKEARRGVNSENLLFGT